MENQPSCHSCALHWLIVETDALITTLVRRSRNGDEEALGNLLRWLEPVVVRTARLVVGAGSWAAEDAAQEAMLDITRGIGGLRDAGAVRAWAIRITVTRAIKVARRERMLSLRRAQTVPDLAIEAQTSRAAALKEAFDQLPARLRVTVVLRLYLGCSEAETADALKCSVGTVKSNLHEAKRRMADVLRERGVAPVTAPEVTSKEMKS